MLLKTSEPETLESLILLVDDIPIKTSSAAVLDDDFIDDIPPSAFSAFEDNYYVT